MLGDFDAHKAVQEAAEHQELASARYARRCSR